MRVRIIGAIVALLLAVVGAFVLFLYVRGAEQRALGGAELVEVYVVTDEIPAGADLETVMERIEVDELPELAVLPDHVTALDQLDGLVAAIDLLPGDQLVLGRFVDPQTLAAQGDVPVPDGLQEVTIALPVDRVVGGAVRPGSQVGLLVSTDGATQFVLNRILVTRVAGGTSYSAADSETESSPVSELMITFALATNDIEKVVWAAEREEDASLSIWLTLQSQTANTDGSQRVTGSTIYP